MSSGYDMGIDTSRRNVKPRPLTDNERARLEEFLESIHYSSRSVAPPRRYRHSSLTTPSPLQVLGQRIRIQACAVAKAHAEGHTKGVPRLLKGDTEAALGRRVAVNGHHPGTQRVKTRRPHEPVGTRPVDRHGQPRADANPPFYRVSAGNTTRFTNRSRTFCSSSTSALDSTLHTAARPRGWSWSWSWPWSGHATS